jgi:hypothetical protein
MTKSLILLGEIALACVVHFSKKKICIWILERLLQLQYFVLPLFQNTCYQRYFIFELDGDKYFEMEGVLYFRQLY